MINQTDTDTLMQKSSQFLMNTYGRFPVAFVDGYNSTLVDLEGKEYSDFLAGIAVSNLGYSNEKVQAALIHQAQTLIHTSNNFHIEPQTELAQLLCEQSFASKVFFGNSGAEANEGAMKIARKRAYQKYGSHKNEIVAMKGSFHGRTLATLSITDNDSYREGFGPHPEGFHLVPFNDAAALEAAVSEKTAAVILEPIQGEGGVHAVDPAYLKKARELTNQYDCALIFDEVQCGMGRTGKLFAYEHYEIEPDIMTLAKALGNGVPIGAILAKGDYAEVLAPGNHGTTFGGNPLATAVGRATLEEMLARDLPDQARVMGDYFKQKLGALKEASPLVEEVRGMGLLLGMELSIPGIDIVRQMLDRGFIINCTQGKVLRFIPPLIITEAEIDRMTAALAEVLAVAGE